MKCLLCHSSTEDYVADVFQCNNCRLIFKNPNIHLSSAEDFKRYSTHQNNSQDQGYIDFLNRLVQPLSNFLPPTYSALDFGCGPGPTLSILLKKSGAETYNYDPIFFPEEKLLEKKYDVVTATEVAEHFKTPESDWKLLLNLVAPNGLLGIMTQMFNDSIDYQSWWYKNDPTHVVFYQKKTFDYLESFFDLEKIYDDNKSVIIYRKK